MTRKYNILNLGSGNRHLEAKHKFGRKQNTFVEPFWYQLRVFERLRLAFRNSELSTLTAHEFLDKAIKQKRTYKKIEIHMPLGGIVSKKMDFFGLCRKMHTVLEKGGQVEMLIDFHSEESKHGFNKLGIFTENDPRKGPFEGSSQIPEDVLPALEKNGFFVKKIIAYQIPDSVINKSTIAKNTNKERLTLLIATKK